MGNIGFNRMFAIKNADGTPFHDLVLRKSTVDSVVMSLGDKVTGDVYYKDNTLAVTMQEYIEYKRNPDDENEDAVKYVLVNPPTVVSEGMASDNSELKGMTKYSFTFYHPMCALSNFPFSDVAVSDDEKKYLSQNKTFTWMGNGNDLIAKLNKNLEGTQWVVVSSGDASTNAILSKFPSQVQAKKTEGEKSDVLSFDKNFISDVLKVFYDNWGIPFVIDSLKPNEYFDDNNVDYYSLEGGSKRFVIVFGNPTNTILDDNDNEFVFRFGQGVGLKNNSRTQKNNKIITRIAGYGSENNIPYGYPQIIWYGDQTWDYTINNNSTAPNSFPIYRGIVNGQYVKLIKHPFTRKNLMPTVYVESVFNKVSKYAPRDIVSEPIALNTNYDPDTEIVDYYDAVNNGNTQYPNPIVPSSPSFEIHQFENIKPQLGDKYVVAISAYDEKEKDSISIQAFTAFINGEIAAAAADNDGITARYLTEMLAAFNESMQETPHQNVQRGYTGGSYTYEWILRFDGNYCEAFYNSPITTFTKIIKVDNQAVVWDDSIDDDGNYKQSYFKMTIQQLEFDLYACASITESMQINMRSGACIGCTFDVQVDWDDYKKNFYDANGDFAPTGSQRDYTKYPDSSQGQITLVVAKDTDTFGTILPDSYRTVAANDAFVILGISLPQSYVTAAQVRLDEAMKEYMLENNVYYYEYPLKFDEHFLATHNNILAQIRNNVGLKFIYGDEPAKRLFVKQMTIKYGDAPLPTYDIVLTDDIEIVLNSVGQVTDDVSRMRVQMSELQKYYGINIENVINEKLSRAEDDIAKGRITFQQGLDAIGRVIFSDEIKSKNFVQGMTDQGRGWRIDAQGNAEFESLRCRSYLEVIELLINRLQAQEGDTLFTDNDQITFVEEKTYSETTYYKLTLKEKWDGYTTCQKVGNIVKGIINTLAANAGNVSDVTPQQSVESDGDNKYFTSWMRVEDPAIFEETVGNNQICVVLIGDNNVPAGKNFAPCELMNIARWGCLDAEEIYGQTPTQAQIEDVKRRQRLFMLSTTDGRITKLRGVNKPILIPQNYGTTLGLVPDFISQWSIASRLKPNMDYLYAQGVIVGDFIKVDAGGEPITNYVDKGEWQNNTEYLHDEYNESTLQYETHDVWHNNAYWRCKEHQPVTSGGTTRYYEPTDANSAYWQKLMYSQQGQQGQNGYNTATLTIYKRIASEPASNDKPYDLTYDFSTGSASGNMNGWSWEIPTANGQPCWTRQVFISSRNSTEEIPSGNWGNPQALVEDGISYEIQVPVESIRFASGQTAYALNGDANFFKKSGSASKVQTQFYYAVYKRTGNSYVKVASGQANKYTFSNLSVPSTIDAITVYIFDASYSGTTPETNGYLAKAEIKVNKDGEQGGSGGNSGTPTLYKRSATEITQTGFSSGFTLYYKFEDGKLYTDEACTTLFVSQNGWTQEIPSGSNPLYVTMAVAFNSGVCDVIGYNEWVTPSKFVENGAQGGHGTNTAPVMIYKRAATAPTDKPVTLYYEFATGLLKKLSSGSYVTPDATTDLLGWSQNIPAHDGNPCWVKQCAAVNTDSYDEINTNEWSSPAVKLVEDGNDAVSYEIVLSEAWAKRDKDNDVTGYLAGKAYKIEGTVRTPLSGATIRYGYSNGQYATTTTSSNGSFNSGSYFADDWSNEYCNESYGIYASIIIDNVSVCLVSVNIAFDGADGESGARGKTGRFFYYAGEWSDFGDSASWEITDAQAPYFSVTDNNVTRYYVYNPEQNGTYTKSQMGSNFNQAPWETMTNDFKYLITEAIFGKYAQFGSAIINGDWMMSQYGYILGFCDTRIEIDDPTLAAYCYPTADPDDMTGEADMYDSSKLMINDTNVHGIINLSYNDSNRFGSVQLTQGRFYTIEIDENTGSSGNILSWKLAKSVNGTTAVYGDITCTNTGEDVPNAKNFLCMSSGTYYLYMKVSDESGALVSSIYLRQAKFVPYYAVDMLAGQIVANNIIARGVLKADSLCYELNDSLYGSNNVMIVTDESIVRIPNQESPAITVILPAPSDAPNRIIEIYSNAYAQLDSNGGTTSTKNNWYLSHVGCDSDGTFKKIYENSSYPVSNWSYGQNFGKYSASARISGALTAFHVKLYSDGTKWIFLQSETAYVEYEHKYPYVVSDTIKLPNI